MGIKKKLAFNLVGKCIFFVYLVSSTLVPIASAVQDEKVDGTSASSQAAGDILDSTVEDSEKADSGSGQISEAQKMALLKANPDLVNFKKITAEGIEVDAPIEEKVEAKKAAQKSQAAMSLPNDGVSKSPQNFKSAKPEVDLLTGALVYKYPIRVPEGILGLTPKVNIIYNSQILKDGSPFGYGWGVDIPYIERQNKTGTDKMYLASNFVHSDLGELRFISGSNYGLRIDTGQFLNFVFTSNAWTVKDKQGNIYSYGSSTSARQDNVASTTQVFRWMLEKVQDVNGNVINYSYNKDSGQIYISSIKYVYNGSTPLYKIDFATTTTPSRKSYQSAFLVDNKFLINNIKVSNGSSVGMEYVINYNSATISSPFATINNIVETAYGSTGNKTNTTAFQYTDNNTTSTFATSSSYHIPTDINRASNGVPDNWVVVDYNNDSLPDFIKCTQMSGANCMNATKWKYYKNNGSDWVADATTTNLLPSAMLGNSNEAFFTDFNGDKKMDVVVTEVNGVSPNTLYLHQGNEWVLSSTTSIPYQINYVDTYTSGMYIINGNITYSGWRTNDINNDGVFDFALYAYNASLSTTTSKLIYLSNSTSTTLETTNFQNMQGTYFTISSGSGNPYGTFLDSNNDGLTDLFQNFYNPLQLATSSGTNWLSISPTNYLGEQLQGNYINFPLDLNGDGYLDFMYQDNLASGTPKSIYINQHTDNTATSTTGPNMPSSFKLGYWPASIWTPCCNLMSKKPLYFVDVNGDGLNDILEILTRGTETPVGATREVWINPAKIPGLLKTISIQEGGTYNFGYKSSAQYIDGSGNNQNPSLPFIVQTVNTVAVSDGIGNISTTTYSYSGGSYYFNNIYDKRFAGFEKVVQTNQDNSSMINYYYQGNTSSSTLYEYNDSVSKIGKIYRTDLYDPSSSLSQRSTTKYDFATTTTDRFFVFPIQTINEHDGTGEAVTYDYSTTTGNLSNKVEWGTVTVSDPLTFSDTGNDKRTTYFTYGNSTTTNVTVPTNITLKDQSSVKVAEQVITYDGGTVSKGLPTNIASWVATSTYNNTQKSYYSSGQVNTITDPRGKVTTYTYDSNNLLPTTIAKPLSLSKSFTYNYAVQKPLQITDENNRKFSFTYDGYGRLITESIPVDSSPTSTTTKNTYSYNDVGTSTTKVYVQKVSSDPTTNFYTIYDGLGKVIRSITQSGSSTYLATDTTYDSLYRISNSSLPYSYGGSLTTYSGNSSPSNYRYSFTYDGLNRVKSVSDSIGTTNTTYSGNTTTVTDANNKVKAYTKDGLGRLIQVTENLNGSSYNTYYNWDPNDKLTKITDASSNIRNFTYDGEGKRLTAEDLHAVADGTFGSLTYTYDASGNMTQKSTPNGDNIIYTFDDVNRVLTEKISTDSNPRISYSYDTCTDGKTRLCGVTNINGVNYGYTYTPNGNTKTEGMVIPGLVGTSTTSYTYDVQQNLKNITSPDSTQVIYSYSYRNLPSLLQYQSTSTPINIVTNISYNEAGALATTTFSNNVSIGNYYDSTKMLRLINKQTQLSGATTTLQNISYTYDNVGNILSLTDTSNTDTQKTVSYGYDDLYRLISASTTAVASGTSMYSSSYSYNIIGNLLTNNENTYTYSGTSYGNPHALSSIASTTYSYDYNGNFLTDGTTTNVWNYKNELGTSTIALSTSTSAVSNYLYNQNSLRVKVSNASSTIFNLNKYFRTDTSTTTKNLYLGDALVATVDTASTTNVINYYLTDHLGSTEKVLSSSGAIASLNDYFPFGEQRLQQGDPVEKSYIGEIYDPSTSYNYLNARYLSSDRGQFISQDPVFWEVGLTKDGNTILTDPQLQNSYSYAKNNPILLKDKDGRCPICIAGIGYALEIIGAAMTTYSAVNIGQHYYNGTQDQLTGWDYAGAVPGVAVAKVGGVMVNSTKAVVGLEKTNDLLKLTNNINSTRNINDLSSLRGASIDEVQKVIPENWIKSVARDGEGIRYSNPLKRGDQIIIEKGSKNPSSPNNVHAGDYLKVSRDGKVERVPLKDNPSLKNN